MNESHLKAAHIYKDLMANIIYQDKHIIILNKPINLAVQGGNKVKYSVDDILNKDQAKGKKLYRLTHRLDKDTSGILILAKTEKAAQKITKLFANKKIYKTYLALVVGCLEQKTGIIDFPIIKKKLASGKEVMTIAKTQHTAQAALTKYHVIEQLGNQLSLLKLEPETGRKHQIRIHLSAMETPILGDGKYGGKKAFMNNLSNKIHLHAEKIYIENYFGKPLSISAPLPAHMKETLGYLGISAKNT